MSFAPAVDLCFGTDDSPVVLAPYLFDSLAQRRASALTHHGIVVGHMFDEPGLYHRRLRHRHRRGSRRDEEHQGGQNSQEGSHVNRPGRSVMSVQV